MPKAFQRWIAVVCLPFSCISHRIGRASAPAMMSPQPAE